MMKIILIDDEKDALEALEWKIKRIIDNVQITKSSSPIIGVDLVKEIQPDIVFLDIQMPEMDGFSFIDKFQDRNFEVIFTTAHDEYGIKAVKAKALDYLLKPVDVDELTLAIAKLKNEINNKKNKEEESLSKINIQADGKVYLLAKEEVLYLKSDKSYTTIHLTKGKKIIATKTLKQIQKKFNAPEFLRVHNSYVVNLKHVIEYNKSFNELKLKDNTIVAVSRSKKNELIKTLNLE
ncbi:LytR/AlgR family response regulator transcription factor [Tenacibaculum amylolyticum]|uniref:LytR/AlgR family response regulator transcription factor n=1 Tax=Tenacibaculum amylolyticum TaxID=104269 RepID=UPI003895FDA6